MSKILEAALRAVTRTQIVEALVVHTASEVVYRIPKGEQNVSIMDVDVGDDYITIKALKVEKICPVSKSPLDAYRGRGLHSPKRLIE